MSGPAEHPGPRLTAAARELRDRIHRDGPVTFAEFMAAALYSPEGGYYARRDPLGPEGDFYTAPLAHPVFGALLARQLLQCWKAMGEPAPFWAIEPGAANGRLAADICAHAPLLDPAFNAALRYVCLDVRRPTAPATGDGVGWVMADGLPLRGVRGCIIANELLDAMPVHRLTMRDGRLQEVWVGLGSGSAFAPVPREPSSPALARRLADLGVTLAEGAIAEVNLGLERWLTDAGAALDAGWLLVIDYGHDAPAYYDVTRSGGTLRCYYRHTLNANPYQHVGEQDISVHVELTSVRRVAEAAGFVAAGDVRQETLLRNLGFGRYRQDIARRGLPRHVAAANLRAVDELVDADGLGGFRALAFAKGVASAPLMGFAAGHEDDVPFASAPLLGPGHLPPADGGAGQPMPSWSDLLR